MTIRSSDHDEDRLTSATLNHERQLVVEAVSAVASGRFPRVTVAGIRFGDELLDHARRLAESRGLRVRPLSRRDELGSDLVVERGARSAGKGAAMGRATILLVEDDGTLRATLARNLRAHGHHVAEAETAEEAVDQLRGGVRPAFVLLDINLPGETGWSLLRAPELAAAGAPPVVIATATSVSPRRLREFGVAGYLPKPFSLETLRSTIERLLAKGPTDR